MAGQFRGHPLSSCAALGALVDLSAGQSKAARDGVPREVWWFAFDRSMGDKKRRKREVFETAFLDRSEIKFGALPFPAAAYGYTITPAQTRDLTDVNRHAELVHRNAVWRHAARPFSVPDDGNATQTT
jgi:hypothetical protein